MDYENHGGVNYGQRLRDRGDVDIPVAQQMRMAAGGGVEEGDVGPSSPGSSGSAGGVGAGGLDGADKSRKDSEDSDLNAEIERYAAESQEMVSLFEKQQRLTSE